MKSMLIIVCRCIGFSFLYLLLMTANATDIDKKKHSITSKSDYQEIDWSQYSLTALKSKVPKKFYGQDVSLLPIQSMYFLPAQSTIEMSEIWGRNENNWPEAIVISNGVYNLEQIERLINNPLIFKKINKKSYISYRPIYLAPTAKLIINNKELRLSLKSGVFFISNGELYLIDSTLTSWDESAGNYGVREHISENKLLFYGLQRPRPYLLGLTGSETYAANSTFRGLGYKGQFGSFGLSMAQKVTMKNAMLDLSEIINRGEKPTGWLLGNTFEHNFFGFYSNKAEKVVIMGNVYSENIIYNIDPHDFSNNLFIARNLSYMAKHSHGIIISREVNNSIIAENLSIENMGSGIMLDRNCEHNLIFNNLALENKGDGIAIFESDNNEIIDNTVARNEKNGIFVRNSCNIKVESNYLFRNVKSGSEIAVVNIDYTETRDFLLDPYHQSANANYLNNTFDSNLGSALSSKNNPASSFTGNQYENSGSLYFSGDLERYNRVLISYPKDKTFAIKGDNQCP